MTEPSDTILLRHDEGGIARLTLNRPDAFNSLSLGLLARLQSELDRIAEDRAAKGHFGFPVNVITEGGFGRCQF